MDRPKPSSRSPPLLDILRGSLEKFMLYQISENSEKTFFNIRTKLVASGLERHEKTCNSLV
jgi:hypothetical protein